ncbi:MAG: hypothetical protein K8R63_12690 [Bacteroidales bacterium]|nr:hypothetical protein [Bacteroidales bacterium]
MNTKKNKLIVPYSLAGKWSVGLIGLCILFLIMFGLQIRFHINYQIGEGHGFFNSPGLAISLLGAVVSGILSFCLGVFAIFMKKDRSVFVLLSCGIGSLVSSIAILYLLHAVKVIFTT